MEENKYYTVTFDVTDYAYDIPDFIPILCGDYSVTYADFASATWNYPDFMDCQYTVSPEALND